MWAIHWDIVRVGWRAEGRLTSILCLMGWPSNNESFLFCRCEFKCFNSLKNDGSLSLLLCLFLNDLPFVGQRKPTFFFPLAMGNSSHILLGVAKHNDHTFTSIFAYYDLLKKTAVEDDAFVIFSFFFKTQNDKIVMGCHLHDIYPHWYFKP